MATINSKGQLLGTVGSYSFRIVNGKAIVQSKPGKNNMKQTEATKSSASEFGKANNTAKKIRLALVPIIQNLADPKMYNRFAVKVHEAVLGCTSLPKGNRNFAEGDLSVMANFQLNNNSPFQKFASFSSEITLKDLSQVQIVLPEIIAKDQIYFTENTTECTVCFLVTALDKTDYTESYSEVFKFSIDNQNSIIASQQWTTPALASDQIIIISRAIFYYQHIQHMGATVLNSKEMHPAEIILFFKTGEV